jgi:TetR/AcrR family transcriptional regulator
MGTKEKILEAAREEFIEHGYDAARMRHIAARAEINKGLLHYYFKTKEALMTEVFESTFRTLIDGLHGIFQSDLPLNEKIELAVERYMGFMTQQQRLPYFLVSEMNRDDGAHISRLKKANISPPFGPLVQAIEEAQRKGLVRGDVDARHAVMNMVSMMLFPFVGKNMVKFIHHFSETAYQKFIRERSKVISDALIRSLKT